MTQSSRSFDSYTQALLLSIEEEHMGETYFATLATFHTGSAKQALLIMSQIEAAVILAMQPLLDRLGLVLATAVRDCRVYFYGHGLSKHLK